MLFPQACQLDPMLDDSVMFARRLRALHRDVSGDPVSHGDPLPYDPVKLDLLADLPHGFLNFVLVSAEAKAGSDRCVAAIRGLLQRGGDVGEPCSLSTPSSPLLNSIDAATRHSVCSIAKAAGPIIKAAIPIVDAVTVS